MSGKQKNTKKFSRTGIVLVGCSLVCVLLALAVGIPNGFFGDGGKGGDLDDKNTPGLEEIMEGQSPLLVFDKRSSTLNLMEAFDSGKVEEVNISSTGMDLGEETSDSQKTIKNVYKALKNITVTGECDSAGDSSDCITVQFVSEDGSVAEFEFFKGDKDCFCESSGGEADNNETSVSEAGSGEDSGSEVDDSVETFYEVKGLGGLVKAYENMAE